MKNHRVKPSSQISARLATFIGMVCINANRQDLALRLFNFAVTIDRQQTLAHIGIANLYQDQEQYEKALQSFETAIELNPTSADVFGMRGELFYAMGDRQLAIKDLSSAILLGIQEASIFNLRGELYLYEDHYSLAIADFQQSLTINSSKAWPYSQLAETYRRTNEIDQSINAANLAVNLEPNDSYMLAVRAQVLKQMARHVDAKADIDKALANRDEDPWDWYGISAALVVTGDIDKAIHMLTKAVGRDKTLLVDLRFDPLFRDIESDKNVHQLFERYDGSNRLDSG